MALETMTAMLKDARGQGYAVGAFNMVDYTSSRAVVRAAEELAAPVIVQTSVKTVVHWGYSAIVSWLREIGGESPVPVALHLDHCRDVDIAKKCIEAGWTSVMFDGSKEPFEKNLASTKEVAEAASSAGVSLEAELVKIVGVEEDIAVGTDDASLADPDEAAAFCSEVDLAAFAPAIGTAHGVYKGTPRIAYDLIQTIAEQTSVPLALHGGTGLADDVFKRCISLGCAKVNISTQIKHAFIDSFVEYYNAYHEYEPLKPLNAQYERIKKEVGENITLFGGAGRAAKG